MRVSYIRSLGTFTLLKVQHNSYRSTINLKAQIRTQAMSNQQMFLWWGSGSCPCWKPMIVLAEKGLWKGLPNKLISFDEEEYRCSDILAINPRGQVPTFKDGELVVNESNAICMYLEEKYSTAENRLLPETPEQRSTVYWKIFEASNVEIKVLDALAYYFYYTKKEDRNDEVIKEKVATAKTELSHWEKALTGKSYLVGDNFTLADVCFYPYIAFLVRLGASLKDYPALRKYYDTITARPSVQATWPPHWREGPTAENHLAAL
ncbi:glutathione S-transferase A-like [Mya arenaria]|uniref:glutathione S-transferase A-like n=1 Tax=Mya arenaria TaxID=6604 RepID=UPI0022E45CC1|nr:glutathione S-transferase A-like [Mya arenaria]